MKKLFVLIMSSMRNLVSISIILIGLFYCISSSAQREISGKVSDTDGNSISNIEVKLKNEKIGSVSNSEGRYKMIIPDDVKKVEFSDFRKFLLKKVNFISDNEIDLILEKKEFNVFDLTLRELMNIKIKIASKIALTQTESPAIVSVVTQDEILNSGARDIIDVLRLIPGIDFNGDVWGMVGISMNGNWGNNGEILLMIDGLEQNEIAFSSLFFGNYYPVENIKRIEIIRGPGSSIN